MLHCGRSGDPRGQSKLPAAVEYQTTTPSRSYRSMGLADEHFTKASLRLRVGVKQ